LCFIFLFVVVIGLFVGGCHIRFALTLAEGAVDVLDGLELLDFLSQTNTKQESTKQRRK